MKKAESTTRPGDDMNLTNRLSQTTAANLTNPPLKPDNQTSVDAYRDQVIAWLARKERKWRETSQVGTGAASDAASFYAAAYSNAIQGILDREPEKRAVMEVAPDAG